MEEYAARLITAGDSIMEKVMLQRKTVLRWYFYCYYGVKMAWVNSQHVSK